MSAARQRRRKSRTVSGRDERLRLPAARFRIRHSSVWRQRPAPLRHDFVRPSSRDLLVLDLILGNPASDGYGGRHATARGKHGRPGGILGLGKTGETPQCMQRWRREWFCAWDPLWQKVLLRKKRCGDCCPEGQRRERRAWRELPRRPCPK